MALGNEPTTDDFLELAMQWQKDTSASGDATIVAASILWFSHVVNAAIKDLGNDIGRGLASPEPP